MNAYSENAGRRIALLLIAGSGVVTIAKGMSLTFLAIRLQSDFGLSPAGIGALIGAGPLLGAIVSPFAGMLSDRIGRKGVLTAALLMAGLALAGLGLAQSIAAFALAHIVSAVAAAVYEPVARALMSDAAPAHLRLKVFSWRYLAINAGWAIGPLIGVWVGAAYATLFVAAGVLHAAFGLVLFLSVPEASNRQMIATERASPTTGGWRGLAAALRDRRLVFFVVGGTLLLAVHGQWSVTLSQYLNAGFEDGVTLFALLVSTNAATVLIASTPARFVIERIGALRALSLGCLLFLVGEIGFAASSDVEMLIASMILFTIGEVLVVPSEYVLVDGISDAGNRGTYFGAHSLASVGNFLGPLIGGLALGTVGGTGMFLLFALLSAASALMFAIGQSMPPPRPQTARADASNSSAIRGDLLRMGQFA
ncbi:MULTISPECIES: MFS transporter [unclassified Ensifer]|uniref:MFS transporter n=1 Tax=unclassified Ensifer TaxID=2633371 RepID=UPI0008132453|nr:MULTISPECIES: MFS transporter [unclassified Ensifer]OCO98367.1 MFS transporter [Ensifer sp. LC13]OCP05247.1 MFS transporter [Ensifer sp. LC14]OCP14597.1 MFS transporter [Ensifer sp. LC11]OCP29260.1 MFS transporter [Ensifer sp. LC499]